MNGSDNHTPFGYLHLLRNSILEDFQKNDLLVSIVDDIETALNEGNYTTALYSIDELEEFMDLQEYFI